MKPQQPAKISGFLASFFAPGSRSVADEGSSRQNTVQILAQADRTIANSEQLRAQGSQAIEKGRANFKAIDSEIAASTAIRGMT